MRGKDEMTQDGVIEKIASMGQVVAILHTVGFIHALSVRQKGSSKKTRTKKCFFFFQMS